MRFHAAALHFSYNDTSHTRSRTVPLRKKIFVIDDDEDIRDGLKLFLENDDFSVETFATGKAGLKKALTAPPSIVLFDYFLPGEDTPRLITKLRGDKATKHVPVILISANTEAKKAAEGLSVSAFFAKPFQIDMLANAIEKLCKKRLH